MKPQTSSATAENPEKVLNETESVEKANSEEAESIDERRHDSLSVLMTAFSSQEEIDEGFRWQEESETPSTPSP